MGSLRYLRPYWMLHMKNVKNWRIYTKSEDPGFKRTEMLYQSWLGGIDRPYARPPCTVRTPTWLTRKRFALEKPHLTAETPVEILFVEFQQKYYGYRSTLRPVIDDLHNILDLVEAPLDMSYACRTLSHMHNDFLIPFEPETFSIFVHAAMKVDRKDLLTFALASAEKLGFDHVDEQSRLFIEGKSSWYKTESGYLLPKNDNEAHNTPDQVEKRLQKEKQLLDEAE